MAKFPAANIISFRAEQPQPQTSYLPSDYPLKHCPECERVLYGCLDTITGEVVYECNQPRAESNDSPHFLSLAIPTQEPKPLDGKCNLPIK